MSSSAQVTCSECGATMLASTAARTGGLCMACKQGIRKHIESARVYYQQQRLPDPFRDYWRDLVRSVHDTPDGFYRLSPQEQTYFSVCLLDGEVYNGGMHQFFYNSSGDHYAEALRGLRSWEHCAATSCLSPPAASSSPQASRRVTPQLAVRFFQS